MIDYLRIAGLPWLYIAVGGGIQIVVLVTGVGGSRWMTVLSIGMILYGALGLHRLQK